MLPHLFDLFTSPQVTRPFAPFTSSNLDHSLLSSPYQMEFYGIEPGPSIHLATSGSGFVSATQTTRHARHASFASSRTRRNSFPDETDDARSWVMLKQNGEIEPLEGETVLLKTPGNVSLELKVPEGLRTSSAAFSVKCNDGTAYVTTQRVSHVPRGS